MPPGAAEISAPSPPVTPPQACTALWYKRRRGDTDVCGALARSPAFGKPPSRCATGREKRFAVSLIPFWLRAHKVKGKVEAFLKKSFTKKL